MYFLIDIPSAKSNLNIYIAANLLHSTSFILSIHHLTMPLAPPEEGVYPSLDDLIQAINKHAGAEGYAVVRGRSKRSKKGVTMKAFVRCDAHGEAKFAGSGHRVTSSRKKDCEFTVIAKLEDNYEDSETGEGRWHLKVVNPHHSHPSTGQSAHPVLRKIAMDYTVKKEIEKEFVKGSKAAATLVGLRLDGDSGNPIFKPQDIWNARQELKAKQLGCLTPTQALMKTLDDEGKWYMDHKKKRYSDELE